MKRLSAALLATLLWWSPPALAITNGECLDCHRDATLTLQDTQGKDVSLYVGAAEFSSSVHADLGCTDCHQDAVEIPHAEGLKPVDCASCHSDVQDVYAGSIHGKAHAKGSADAPTCTDCHGTHNILPPSNPASTVNPLKLVATCARCHADPAVVQRAAIGQKAPVEAYMRSIHGKALLSAGDPNAPNCSTCHPAHEMLAAGDPASTVNRSNVAQTCGQCHGEVYEQYSGSVHGVALSAGKTDAPTCTDCHGEHEIEPPSDPNSTVYPANLVKTTCVRCHESLVLARRYGFATDRAGSFRETYHGMASEKGDLKVANCASCHGVHNIYPSEDPRSTVNTANLTTTCGQCHPNASQTFASIQVHPTNVAVTGPAAIPSPTKIKERPAEIVKRIYVLLIAAVIGGMALHNIILWTWHIREKRRRERAMKMVPRFSKFEAVEHGINLVVFFALVFTGFALKFPDAGWVNLTERLGLTESIRGIVHRTCGVLMIGLALVHTGYLLFTKRGRRDLMALRFGIRDIRDAIQNVAYHLGLRKDKPHFPRFDYGEKAEYLALIWGTTVMILTGLVLWFPTIATQRLPAWSFPVSEVVHYYEAWLAFLAIVVWHLYFVIANPEVYPLNLTFLDGKAPEHHLLEKHGFIEGAEDDHKMAVAAPSTNAPPAAQDGKADREMTTSASK
ncbi:MAG: cytochrome c3 family protein [Candidatus Eisenbacteria bacterium]